MSACAITGLGAVSALGEGVRAIASALEKGATGIRPIATFDASRYASQVAGEVPDPNLRKLGCTGFAVAAAREAMIDARLPGPVPPARMALVVGTSAGVLSRHAELAAATGASLGLLGPRLAVSTACASSNVALGWARELLDEGVADVVLAGGAEALLEKRFAGFHALRALGPEPAAPFSTPPGMSLGEGAAFLVLERPEHARARGVPIRAELTGSGASSDAWHPTAPDPRGLGMARAIEEALRDAGLAPSDVGLYNAHGTGTEANDAAEWQAVLRTLGPDVPITAPKAIFGHTFGAAGALEAIVTVLALERGMVPPTPTFRGPRAGAGPARMSAAPRHASYDHAVSHNASFGGANATLVLSRPGTSRAIAREPAPVTLAAGAIAAPSDAAPRVNTAGMDPLTRAFTAAAAKAASGLRRPLDRVGLFLGTATRPVASSIAYEASLEANGWDRGSPEAFSRTVLCAAAGGAAVALGLRGPTATLASGPASGLHAVVFAARLLATRATADAMLAGGAEEHDPARAPYASPDGAACILLVRGGDGPRLLGTGLAGPGAALPALQAALRQAGLQMGDLELVHDASSGPSEAFSGVADLVHLLEARKLPCALVSSDPAVASVALVIGR